MADTTISQLPRLAPSANALIPFSQGGTTYATNLSALGLNKFFLTADCGNIETADMPNLNSDNLGYAPMTLPINRAVNYTSNFNSRLNTSNNTISVPYDGLYHISAKVTGYVPSFSWEIRAFPFTFINANNGGSLAYFGHFNCCYAGYSNTHFCFQPFATLFLTANTSVYVSYLIFSKSSTSQAMIQPLYNDAYLSIVQLS